MKKTIFLFLLFLYLPNVLSFTSSTALISLTVINNPPIIKEIFIFPDTVFEDTSIICNASYIDENPKNVIPYYFWYKNGQLLHNEKNYLLQPISFKEGDTITCQITPGDYIQNGSPKIISTIIKPTPFKSKITKTALKLVGSNLNTYEIESIQNKGGFTAITGYAIQDMTHDPKPALLSFLSLIFIILILLNLLLLRTFIKRKKN